MTHTEAEIRSQPASWRTALEKAAGPGSPLSIFFRESPLALVGAGSSYYVAMAAASYAREALGIDARAEAASVYRPLPKEGALFISRSGTTTEVLEAARLARERGSARLVAITCDAESPLAAAAHEVVCLDWIQEQSVVQTGSATSALLLLRAVIDRLAGRHPPSALPGALEQAMQRPLPSEGIDHVVVLGSGWRYGVACEAALKAQEMALVWSERYLPLEYRHGPISCADARTLVLILDPPAPRVDALACDVAALGARVARAEHDPLIELVRLQQAMLQVSLRKGLDPDRPRHLQRSVLLA